MHISDEKLSEQKEKVFKIKAFELRIILEFLV